MCMDRRRNEVKRRPIITEKVEVVKMNVSAEELEARLITAMATSLCNGVPPHVVFSALLHYVEMNPQGVR